MRKKSFYTPPHPYPHPSIQPCHLQVFDPSCKEEVQNQCSPWLAFHLNASRKPVSLDHDPVLKSFTPLLIWWNVKACERLRPSEGIIRENQNCETVLKPGVWLKLRTVISTPLSVVCMDGWEAISGNSRSIPNDPKTSKLLHVWTRRAARPSGLRKSPHGYHVDDPREFLY